jgi:hypothetical protein
MLVFVRSKHIQPSTMFASKAGAYPSDAYLWSENTKGGKYHCSIDLLFDWFGIGCMAIDIFCSYLQNRFIQTGQTGGQLYSDTSPFSVSCSGAPLKRRLLALPPKTLD